MFLDLVKRAPALPSGSKMLILGCGYAGNVLSNLLKAQNTLVISTRRQLRQSEQNIIFDSDKDIIPDINLFKGVTHLLSSIPPGTDGRDPVIKLLKRHLKSLDLKWVGYLSSTGVYGDTNGKWVSEEDNPLPTIKRSKIRLSCEKEWLSLNLPIQILRLPGIYGPNRSVLTKIRNRQTRIINKTGQYFCRIHVEDIAGACLHLIEKSSCGNKPEIINIVDDRPSANAEVIRYAHKLLNISLPKEFNYNDISNSMSDMAK